MLGHWQTSGCVVFQLAHTITALLIGFNGAYLVFCVLAQQTDVMEVKYQLRYRT